MLTSTGNNEQITVVNPQIFPVFKPPQDSQNAEKTSRPRDRINLDVHLWFITQPLINDEENILAVVSCTSGHWQMV